MIDKGGLLALAERCEQATGPDREFDELIAQSIGWSNIHRQVGGPMGTTPAGVPQCRVPKFTASLDAAKTLVPEAYYWSVGTIAQDGYEHYDDMDFAWGQVVHRMNGNSINVDSAATAPLALCAAALRARAA